MNSESRPRAVTKWIFITLGGLVLLAALTLLIVTVGYRIAWTGFGPYPPLGVTDVDLAPAVPQREKTLWDWMELLIVPLVLAGGAFWFNWSQRKAEKRIEDRRSETEQDIAARNRREASLQAYLDKLTEVLIEDGLTKPGVKDLIRARTFTTLRTLDPVRKGLLLTFLHEAGLILRKIDEKGEAVPGFISLGGADLSNAFLGNANLRGVDLSCANLHGARLMYARLNGATLRGAYLANSNLFKADLSNADLSNANLRDANLTAANVTDEQLRRALHTDTVIR
jgi:hypothetical protein